MDSPAIPAALPEKLHEPAVRSQSANQQHRLVQLDVLRGLAILLVLFRHPAVNFEKSRSWHKLAKPLYIIGWSGVDLFFVLSGFLIGGLLFAEIRKTGKLDIKRFLIRRGFKIWPSYFLLLLVVFILDITRDGMSVYQAFITGDHARNLQALWPNLLHLQNYFPSPRGHTWSLSVEEHFYLALPIFLLVALRYIKNDPRHRMAAVPWAAAIIAVGCLAWRVFLNRHLRNTFHINIGPTQIRIDSLFFGVFLAYLHHYHRNWLEPIAQRQGFLLIGAALLVGPFFHFDQQRVLSWTIGFTMMYLGYGALVLAAVYSDPQRDLLGKLLVSWPARVIAMIGVFSYSIYLWQQDLGADPYERWIAPHFLPLSGRIYWPIVQGGYIVWVCLAGVIMAKLVETPSLVLRDRLFPPRSSPVAIR